MYFPEFVLCCGVKAAQRVNGPRTESLLCSEYLLTLASSPMNLDPQTGKPKQVFLVLSLVGTLLPNSINSGAGM